MLFQDLSSRVTGVESFLIHVCLLIFKKKNSTSILFFFIVIFLIIITYVCVYTHVHVCDVYTFWLYGGGDQKKKSAFLFYHDMFLWENVSLNLELARRPASSKDFFASASLTNHNLSAGVAGVYGHLWLSQRSRETDSRSSCLHSQCPDPVSHFLSLIIMGGNWKLFLIAHYYIIGTCHSYGFVNFQISEQCFEGPHGLCV